jgi:hypothetical protein
MFAACMPLGPALMLKGMRWLSFHDLKPAERIPEKRTNRSPSHYGPEVMKPKALRIAESVGDASVDVQLFHDDFSNWVVPKRDKAAATLFLTRKPRRLHTTGLAY